MGAVGVVIVIETAVVGGVVAMTVEVAMVGMEVQSVAGSVAEASAEATLVVVVALKAAASVVYESVSMAASAMAEVGNSVVALMVDGEESSEDMTVDAMVAPVGLWAVCVVEVAVTLGVAVVAVVGVTWMVVEAQEAVVMFEATGSSATVVVEGVVVVMAEKGAREVTGSLVMVAVGWEAAVASLVMFVVTAEVGREAVQRAVVEWEEVVTAVESM